MEGSGTVSLFDAGAPFVGPRPFERADARIFFGRESEISELVSLVVAYRIVVVYAVSGAGKTSLLNAGLIPRLEREEGFEVLPVARVRGVEADATLPSAPENVYVFNVLSNWSETLSQGAERITRRLSSVAKAPHHSAPALAPPGLTGKLTRVSFAEYLARRPHPMDIDGFPAPRTVIFDQFEELFTLHPEHWRQRAAFLKQVTAALEKDDLLRVVFALREEFLAELNRYRNLFPSGYAAQIRLTPLAVDGALHAVTKPVEPTTRSFAPGVAETLVGNLQRMRVVNSLGETMEVEGEFVEPVQLQVVCRSLWSKLPSDVCEIDEQDLLQFGDVDEVLAGFYSEAVEAAAAAAGIDERELRVWVEEQFITRNGTRGTVYHTRDTTAGMPNGVIDELEARHLIRAEWRSGARWYELTHDRFIGPIRASNRSMMHEPVTEDEDSRARRRASQALARAEAAWQESLADVARTSQEEAIRIYDSIGDGSSKANTLMRMSELRYRARDLSRARKLAEQAHDIYEGLDDALGVADALRAIGRVAVSLGSGDYVDPLTAALDIYSAEGQSVGAAWTLLTMSAGLHVSSERDEAIAVAEHALSLFQVRGERAGAAAALMKLGELYVEAGRPADALEKYDRAREIHWDLADLVSASGAIAQTGYILCDDEQYLEAAARFTEAIRLFPDDVYSYFGRATAYLRAEFHLEAAQDFTRVLGFDDDAAAHAGRGHALAAMGQPDRALADFDGALEVASDDRVRASARSGRGLVLGQIGRVEEAMTELAAALELCPDNGFIYYNRALLHQDLGDPRATRENLTAALRAGTPRLSGPKRARAEGLL
jgi:tetratricopeptide (TPR) repeat protein